MKITKEMLQQVIKEEIENLVGEQEVEQGQEQDKTATRAGKAQVAAADKYVDAMMKRSSNLKTTLDQLRGTQSRKLALARALLVKVVGMEPAMIDRMIAQMTQATK